MTSHTPVTQEEPHPAAQPVLAGGSAPGKRAADAGMSLVTGGR